MLQDIIKDAELNNDRTEKMCFIDETVKGLNISQMEFKLVQFIKCRFIDCDFSGTCFHNMTFDNCDLSNCVYKKTYWKGSTIQDCKADGSNFNQSDFKEIVVDRSSFRYANCVNTLWENCSINNCNFSESFMSEVKFKKVRLSKVDLTRVDFFKTPLKGVDLSDCTIDGIMLSDTHSELRGAKINVAQAVDVAQLLGVKVV